MAETGESLLKRCEEGHVFDVTRHATCPTCGSPVAGRGRPGPVQNGPGRNEPAQNEPAQSEPPPAATDAGAPADANIAGAPTKLDGARTKLPAAFRGLRGLALAGGAVGAVLLVVAILTSGDQSPDGARSNAVEDSAPTSQAPAVIRQQDEATAPSSTAPSRDAPSSNAPSSNAPSSNADDFNPSTADPYGVWEMYTPTANQGPFRHVIEIRPDGSYSVNAGPYSHAGSMTFTGRVYQLQSRTSAYQDGGAFFRPDPDTIVFEGRLGRTVWVRVQQPTLFDLTDDRIPLPANLPAALKRMAANIRASWRNDAVPVRFEVERTRHGAYELKASFMSPQDSTGLAVTWGLYHTSQFDMGGVNWFNKPLPEAFVDLPEAYAALGAVGPLKRASLGYFNRGGGGNTYDAAAPPAWMINPEAGGGGLVEAVTR